MPHRHSLDPLTLGLHTCDKRECMRAAHDIGVDVGATRYSGVLGSLRWGNSGRARAAVCT
jgi:hypothetical protein